MGVYLLDQYSLLHGVAGMLWRYYYTERKNSFISLLVLHTIFEHIENQPMGMRFINTYFKIWPGKKPKSDSWINSFSDIIASLIGWWIMDLSITKRASKPLIEFSFGSILYFWMFPPYGLLFTMFITGLLYSLTGYNLLFGFFTSYILDKLGLYYGLYEPHTFNNI